MCHYIFRLISRNYSKTKKQEMRAPTSYCSLDKQLNNSHFENEMCRSADEHMACFGTFCCFQFTLQVQF